MTIAEMIQHTSPREVKMQKMGKFWVAYEQSAFLLSQIKQLKSSKRFVKSAGQEVVSVGFPDEVLQRLTVLSTETGAAPPFQITAREHHFIVLESSVVFNQANFDEWKSKIALSNQKKMKAAEQGVDTFFEVLQSQAEPTKSNLYGNLPVFRAAYELLRFVYRESGNMNRAYRFTLGENMQKAMSELMLNVYRANCNYDKQPHIVRARENTEMVRLMLRVAFDEDQITLKHSIFANEQIESISKQLTAWGRSQIN
jgi:hypothetical protein